MALATAALALAASSGRAAGSQPASRSPATIARLSGAVYAVAQSRTAQAWRLCREVDVRRLDGRPLPRIRIPGGNGAFRCYALGSERPGDTGGNADLIHRNLLLLVGDTVSWSEASYGNDTAYVDFRTAAATTGKRTSPIVPSLWVDSFGGFRVAGPATDGSSLVFALARFDWDSSKCEQHDLGARGCVLLRSSRVSLLGAGQRRTVTTAPAALVAVAGDSVAFVPAHASDAGPYLFAEPRVELVTADGAARGAVALRSIAVELALSKEVLAVISAGSRLETFDVRTLHPRDDVAVPRGAHGLAASGDRIVFASGRRIYGVDGGHPKPRVLATAPPGAVLIGPSLSGRRLLWAEVRPAADTSSIRVLQLS